MTVYFDVMHSILPIGCSPKSNDTGVLAPCNQALGVGVGVPQQLKVLQVVQAHGHVL